MNDKTSPTPASTPPGLTPAQAGRYDRARAVLQDSSEGKDAVNVAYHVGALEIRLGDMLALVRELTAAMAEDARIVGEIRALLASFDWELDDRQFALEKIERIVGGES